MITIIQFNNIFITPVRSLFCPISLSPFHLQSQTNTNLISVSVDLPVLNISWKWDFCVSGFFRLLWCFWDSSLLQSLSVSILMLSSISFQGCTRVLVCSLVHSQVNGLLGCSHFLAIMNNSLMNILKQVFMWRHIFICCGYEPRCGIAGSRGKSVFNFWKNCLFSKVAVPYYTPTSSGWGFWFFHLLPALASVCVLVVTILASVKQHLIVLLMYTSL